MKIIDPSIVQMVNQDVTTSENLQFKLMVRNIEGKSDEPEPDVIRLELMSDNDYFFQYVFE